MRIPPPIPRPPTPLSSVTILLRTWLLVIRMREGFETQMPPPLAPPPPVGSNPRLLWMMLLLIVAKPGPLTTKLKFASPPPLPWLVVQPVSVTLVRNKFEVPAVPGLNSMQPPSPSFPWVPPFFSFPVVGLELLGVGALIGRLPFTTVVLTL